MRSGQAGISKHKFVGKLGHVSEDETGLIYMRARYMDPVLGKFVSEDPAGDGVNWFTYCYNNPVNLLDENGKASGAINPALEIIGALVAIAVLLGLIDQVVDMHQLSPVLAHLIALIGDVDLTIASVKTLMVLDDADPRAFTNYISKPLAYGIGGIAGALAGFQAIALIMICLGEDCEGLGFK